MPALVDTRRGTSVPLSAVRKRASRKRVDPPRQKPVPAAIKGPNGVVGDRPATRTADFAKADAFKKTGHYRAAVRKAYSSQPIKQREINLAKHAFNTTPEGQAVLAQHRDRVRSDKRQQKKYGYLVREVYGKGKVPQLIARLENSKRAHPRKQAIPGDHWAATDWLDQYRVGAFHQSPTFVRAMNEAAKHAPKQPKQKKVLRYEVNPSTGSAKPVYASVTPPLTGAEKAFANTLGAIGKGTKSSVAFLLHQISRPGSAIGAANLGGQGNAVMPGSSVNDVGGYLSGLKEGFLHPEEHSQDWNQFYENQGIKNKWANEAVSLTSSVATDPLTFATGGAGSVAKHAALKAYEEALAKGATEAHAVTAARKVWEAAPAGERVSGVKLGIRGTPALLLSRGAKTHLETRPLGGKTAAMVRRGARGVGIKNVKPLGVPAGKLRNAANAVAPTVRPAGWDKLDWAIARRASRKGRAGEREAQRHASYRLRAYMGATHGWTADQHQAVIDAIEHGTVAALPAELRPVAEQVQTEMGHAYGQRVSAGLSKPLAPGSRVGVGARPVAPALGPIITPQDLKDARKYLKRLQPQLKDTRRETRKMQKAWNSLTPKAKRTMDPAQRKLIQDTIKSHEAAVKKLVDQINNLKATKPTRAAQQQKIRDHTRGVMAYDAAPVDFFPRVLSPEYRDAMVAHAPGGLPNKVVDQSRKLNIRQADMSPDQLEKYERRIPHAVAQYVLQHGRKINLTKLNDRIASLGRDVDPNKEGLSNLIGARRDLYVNDSTGLHPLFDKYGRVDGDAIQHAMNSGQRIFEVDRKMVDAVRSMANGQRGVGALPAALALELSANPNAADEAARGPLAVYDNLQRRLKVLQTSVNPAYHIVNLIGDSFNAAIGGARPGDFAAGQRLRKVESALKRADLELNPMSPTGKLHKANPLSRATKEILDNARGHVEDYAGKKYSDLDIVSLGVSHGALRTGLTSAELRAASRGGALAAESSKAGKVMERLQNVSDWREDLIRLTTFRSALKRGMSPDDAAEWAAKHHFDYADLSPVEQKFFRRVIPFWTFTARNTPLQVRSLAARPGVYATEEKARAQSAHHAGLPGGFENKLRDFEQTGMPWGTPWSMMLKDTKTGHIKAPITAYPKLPFMDLANIPFPQVTSEGQFSPGSTIQEAGSNWLNRVSPLLKVPLEQTLGISTFTGTKQPDQVQAPSWWDNLGLPSKPFQDPRTGKMKRGISWRFLEPLQVTPVTNTLTRQGTTTLHGQPEANNLKWAGWLAGPRPAILDPRVAKINRLYERVDKLTHEITVLQHGVKHERGADWHGKVRTKLDEKDRLLHQIYKYSERTGAKKPAGIPPAKPRKRANTLGGGFGGSGFKAGAGGALGGGFK